MTAEILRRQKLFRHPKLILTSPKRGRPARWVNGFFNRPCLSHGTYTFSAKMAKCPKFHLNGSRGPLRGSSDEKKISTSFDPGVGGATSFMRQFGAIWSKFKFLHYFCLVQPNHTKFSPKYLYKSTMGLTKKKIIFFARTVVQPAKCDL